MAEEPNRCPFCKAQDVEIHHEASTGHTWVVCNSCGAKGPPTTNEDHEGLAIEKWNEA